MPIDPTRLSLIGACILALSLVTPAYTDQVPEEDVPPADPCAPCSDLLTRFGSRRQVFAESSEQTVRLHNSEVLGSITAERARKAYRLAKDCAGVAQLRFQQASEGGVICVVSAADVDVFIRDVRQVLENFARALREQNDISQVIAQFRKLSRAPRSRQQLPSGDSCTDCDALWGALKGIFVLAAENQQLSRTRIDHADAAVAAFEIFQLLKWALCEHRSVILDFDSVALLRNHRYFTWTETWRTIEAIRRALVQSAVEDLCI